MNDLHLLFPQWQGSGSTNELYRGAMLLGDRWNQIPFTPISVPPVQPLTVEQGILGHAPLRQQLQAARETIERRNPDRIFVLGGDCGVEVAPVSFLNQKYAGDLALVWIDAHADLNTSDSSPSGTFHGMPLRVLLGEGDVALLNLAFSFLLPHQVFLAGGREFDPPEVAFMQQQNLKLFSSQLIDRSCADLIAEIKEQNFKHVYIHLDLDVLCPTCFPYVKCPTPSGINLQSLFKLLATLKQQFQVVGCSLLEFVPSGTAGLYELDAIAQLCFDIAPPRAAQPEH